MPTEPALVARFGWIVALSALLWLLILLSFGAL
jgi:hypothetical protein